MFRHCKYGDVWTVSTFSQLSIKSEALAHAAHPKLEQKLKLESITAVQEFLSSKKLNWSTQNVEKREQPISPVCSTKSSV